MFTGLSKLDSQPVALVVGDPARLDLLKPFVQTFDEIRHVSDYRTVKCTTKRGVQFLAMSHGVGSPGAAKCFQELIDIGVKSIIRVGTCGFMQPHGKVGEIAAFTSAVRSDAFSCGMVVPEYPAICDIDLFINVKRKANENGVPLATGMTYSSDLIYGIMENYGNRKQFEDAGVEYAEMETATLYVLSKLCGVRALALGVVVCGMEHDFVTGSAVVRQSVDRALGLVVETIDCV